MTAAGSGAATRGAPRWNVVRRQADLKVRLYEEGFA